MGRRPQKKTAKKGLAKKKGTSGQAVAFLTRNQCIKKLQLSLADFRRLCILKGVYPRDPSKKVKGKDKTYYALKDIQFLMHEPILAKIREMKAHQKKIVRAKGRQDKFKVDLLTKSKPFYMLDHLVKERFPTFIDAVRDMDDPLCMAVLFANLPCTQVKQERTNNCQKLCLEFETYVALSHSLRKIFLSIKGCYFQAEIMGQPVTWLVPYEFSQRIPKDVDYKVMTTFLELYETQLRFINYKLFTSIGYIYPPKIDKLLEDSNAGLSALRMEKIGAAAVKPAVENNSEANGDKPHARLKSLKNKLAEIVKGGDYNMEEEEDGKKGPETDLNEMVGGGADDESEKQGGQDLLFKGIKIFISRFVHTHMYMHVCSRAHARAHTDTHRHTHTHTTHTNIHIHTHTHTHTHTLPLSLALSLSVSHTVIKNLNNKKMAGFVVQGRWTKRTIKIFCFRHAHAQREREKER
jgi:pescadillo protein